MKFRVVRTVGVALLGLSSASALAAGRSIMRLDAVGDLNYSIYSQHLTTNNIKYGGTGRMGYGGGLLGDFGVSHALGVETGALYTVRKINYTTSGTDIPGGTQDQVHIPLVALIGFNNIVSLVAGGFDEVPVGGDPHNNNYGLEGGLRLTVPLGAGGTQFLADARYAHGFAVQPGDYRTNDVHLLIGFSIGGT